MWPLTSQASGLWTIQAHHQWCDMDTLGWEAQGGLRDKVFLRLYLLPTPEGGRLCPDSISEEAPRTCNNTRLRGAATTRAHCHLPQDCAVRMPEAASGLSGVMGARGLLIAQLCLGSPGSSRRRGRLGKPPSPRSLYLGGRPLPEAPGALLTPHWPELCDGITKAQRMLGRWGLGTPAEEGAAVRVRWTVNSVTHRLLWADGVPPKFPC